MSMNGSRNVTLGDSRAVAPDNPMAWGDMDQPRISLTYKIDEVQAKLHNVANVLMELTSSTAIQLDNAKPAPGALNLLDAKVDELSRTAQHLLDLVMEVQMRIV